MKKRCISRLCLFSVLAVSGMELGLSTGKAQTPPPPPNPAGQDTQADVEVLTRGPVHEAFAATISFDAEPGMVSLNAPPEPIEEVPPDQRPEGDNVDWIPGYWAWDDERNDYLWISGVWRSLPPGREWVPGYWGIGQQGYQWTSGYWADAQASETEYLPEPPLTVEIGPTTAEPSPDHVWIPGSWVWHQGRYAWQPGYWMLVQPDWVWIPAHYVWAPRGYVFVDGYWDYAVNRRGVLYAPVHFSRAVYTRPNFSYSPVTVIHTSVFSDHLFVRPRYNHYYFGDYYAPTYRDSGFFASFSFHSSRRGYSPIYTHDRWRHRQDRDWDRTVESNFNRRRDHEDDRPRRTLRDQNRFSNTDERRRDRSFAYAGSVDEVSRDDRDGVRFQRVDNDTRQRTAQRAKDVQRYRSERQRREIDESDDRADRRTEPVRTKAHRSPIAARSSDKAGKNNSPPKRPEHPQPDPKVERKQRKNAQKGDRKGKP